MKCPCAPLDHAHHEYKHYLCHLHRCCAERGIEIEQIGSVVRKPIYKVIVNPGAKKRTICVVSGLHGDEPAGPLGVLGFLQEALFSRFRATRLVLIPVVNPTGFDQHRRRNHANLDLNRHFGDKVLKGEPRIVWSALQEEKMDALLTLHEDPTIHRFYLYYSNPDRRELCRGLSRMAARHLPVYRGPRVHGDPAENGLVQVPNWGRGETLEDRLFKEGHEYITIETPASRDLCKRVRVQKNAIQLLVTQWQRYKSMSAATLARTRRAAG